MKPFLAYYKSRIINVDFIDVVGGRYWGNTVYPEADHVRTWWAAAHCEKIDMQDDNNA